MAQDHDFSFGSKAWNAYYHGRNNSKKKAAKPKLTAAAKKKGFAELDAKLGVHHKGIRQTEITRFARILGPTGTTHAVKIANADLRPFSFEDVDSFRLAGWGVVGASSINARQVARNPAPLGGDGQARGLVILGQIRADTLRELEDSGLDCYPAPRAYREGIKKNPAKSAATAVYRALTRATGRGQAWNAMDLSEHLKTPLETISEALRELAKKGLAHVQGSDLFGECWSAGTRSQPGLFSNPSTQTKAEKKALAWYGKDTLTTEARKIKIADNLGFVEVGQIVAIEYESTKFDGKTRIYRHDVTGRRALHISTDGQVLIVKPGFKITKRGIEG